AAGNAAPGNSGTLNASVQGGMTLSQWFATGEAAKILARYGGGALSDNPAVAAAVSAGAAQQAFTEHVLALPTNLRSTFWTSVYDLLSQINTPESKKRVAALDAAAANLLTPDRIEIPAVYSLDA